MLPLPRRRFSLLLLGLVLAGCAESGPAAREQALAREFPPSDFWLGVTVFAPGQGDLTTSTPPAPPRAQRPARYVIEADQVLRASFGLGGGGADAQGVSEQTFPPQTRQLTGDQMNDLWKILRSSTLVDASSGSLVGRPPTPTETEGRLVYVVSFAFAGDRRTLQIESEGPKAGSRADAERLTDRLAALAWQK